MSKVVLGIDPGFGTTGFAILAAESRGVQLLDMGFLKLDPADHLSRRTGTFFRTFSDKVTQFHITHIALETSFLGKNAQTFLKLGFLRGALYIIADMHALTIHEYPPTVVKSATTGFGRADKDQVARVMMRLFPGLEKLSVGAQRDATDALAIALCGLQDLAVQQASAGK